MTKGDTPLSQDQASKDRDATIVRTSALGIVANLFLAGFKAAIGFLTSSIAITMDALNNLTDAASSIITIVGTKLAAKEPDKAHPFGYGRVEYLSAAIISVLVLYTGVTAFAESCKAIIEPETPTYSTPALAIIAVAVLVKVALGRYVSLVGERVDSASLSNSGKDALLDAAISSSTLAAALIYVFAGVSLEAWLGAAIALVIVKAGIDMLGETFSRILGERADATLVQDIKATITSFPEVHGAYDLIISDYGPNAFQGSVHIEVPDTLSAGKLDELTRRITQEVLVRHRVILTAISVYALNTADEEVVALREAVSSLALAQPNITQIHGFFADKVEKNMRLDLVVSFDAPSRHDAFGQAKSAIQAAYPEYALVAAMDTDFAEL